MKKIIPIGIAGVMIYFMCFLWNAWCCHCVEFNMMEWDPSKRDFGIIVFAITFFFAVVDNKK